MKTRIIALLMVMVVLVLSFASCKLFSKNRGQGGNDLEPATENYPWPATEIIYSISENSDSQQLPSSSRRYLAGKLDETEAADHSRVDDYVAERNKDATDYTGITVNYQYLPDTSTYGWGQNINFIHRNATGGAPDAPDVYINFVYDMVAASLKGAFANLYSTTMHGDGHEWSNSEHNYFAFEDNRLYKDTGKDYMIEYMKSLTLSKTKMYCLSSDYFVDMVRAFFVVPVNIQLLEEIVVTDTPGLYNTDRVKDGKYTIDDFYQLVWDYEWNYETLAGFSNEITRELGGEGTTLQDRVGFALGSSSGLPASGMLYTTSITIVKREFKDSDYEYSYPNIKRNPDGSFSFDDKSPDTTFEKLDTFCKNLSELVDNNGVITVSREEAAALGYTTGEAEGIRKKFASNNMLFGGVIVLGALEHEDYLGMKGEGKKGYGIAPVPLYHTDLEDGEQYLTQVHNNGKIGAISFGTKKFAQCTAYLNYQSTNSNKVLNEYYNQKLKQTVQVVGADGNSEMLNYIRGHVRSSFDKAFEDALGEHYKAQSAGLSEENKWHSMIRAAGFQLTDMRAKYASIAATKAENLYNLEHSVYLDLPN